VWCGTARALSWPRRHQNRVESEGPQRVGRRASEVYDGRSDLVSTVLVSGRSTSVYVVVQSEGKSRVSHFQRGPLAGLILFLRSLRNDFSRCFFAQGNPLDYKLSCLANLDPAHSAAP
jgi:hypothetical protein